MKIDVTVFCPLDKPRNIEIAVDGKLYYQECSSGSDGTSISVPINEHWLNVLIHPFPRATSPYLNRPLRSLEQAVREGEGES